MSKKLDTLQVSEELQQRGFSEQQAKAMTKPLDAIVGNLATKDDLLATKDDLEAGLDQLRAKMATKADLEAGLDKMSINFRWTMAFCVGTFLLVLAPYVPGLRPSFGQSPQALGDQVGAEAPAHAAPAVDAAVPGVAVPLDDAGAPPGATLPAGAEPLGGMEPPANAEALPDATLPTSSGLSASSEAAPSEAPAATAPGDSPAQPAEHPPGGREPPLERRRQQ